MTGRSGKDDPGRSTRRCRKFLVEEVDRLLGLRSRDRELCARGPGERYGKDTHNEQECDPRGQYEPAAAEGQCTQVIEEGGHYRSLGLTNEATAAAWTC